MFEMCEKLKYNINRAWKENQKMLHDIKWYQIYLKYLSFLKDGSNWAFDSLLSHHFTLRFV